MSQTGGMTTPEKLRISFVCTGNICRSPMAEVIFRELAERAGVADRFDITSRGTHDYHIGKGADPRTVIALANAGYDGSAHRAAQLSDADIADHDVLVALDRGHAEIMAGRGAGATQVTLFTIDDPAQPEDPDVFDPYYSDQQAFDEVLVQIERTSAVLLERLTAPGALRSDQYIENHK